MRIVLLGAPGAGKGTQCKHIVDRYHVLHLSSGDILRRERSQGTELGKKAQSYMDSGALVPDELIVEMMACAIEQAPESGYVLDGFPRTVNQACRLDEYLNNLGEKLDVVLNLGIDDSVVMERMTGRRSCPQCGAVYHVKNLKPEVDNKCDNDGADLIQRPDDKPEVVKKRLQTYHNQTEPLIEYYKDKGIVYDIDAERNPEQVKESVFQKLDFLVSV